MPCAVRHGGAAEFPVEAGAPGEEGQEPGGEHGQCFEFYAAGGRRGVFEGGDDGGEDGAFPGKGWVQVGCTEDGYCWMSDGFGEGDLAKGVSAKRRGGRRTWMEMEILTDLGVFETASKE